MTKTSQADRKKASPIILSASRDIPFNKLILSQSNVRKIKGGQSIEDLAEDIARRTLLQSLNVRAVVDADGAETGMYEIPAGGRRYRALELLVKQKRMAKDQPVPCIIREGGLAEEDSLAENAHREALHPLDQFRAFQALKDTGLSDEDIAARFFVTAAVVRQRLKLASVSPRLLDLYEAGEVSLEQLMAFTITDDHARQEQVWETIQQGWNKHARHIRQLLTDSAVSGDDRRVVFVGLDIYQQAGGVIVRDLFEDDSGGWLQDAGLLDRLAEDRLRAEAATIGAEGWKWVSAAIDFPYGHTQGLRRVRSVPVEPSAEETATRAALTEEYDRLQAAYEDADSMPEEVDARLAELETLVEAIDDRPMSFEADDIARAGVFVSISAEGRLRIERGFVRPEDEASSEAGEGSEDGDKDDLGRDGRGAVITVGDKPVTGDEAEESPEKPLSDRLVADLTAWRTLALRDAVAGAPDIAFLAVLHALTLRAFYRYSWLSCLEITASSSNLGTRAADLANAPPAVAIDARHQAWEAQLPEQADDLWQALSGFDAEARMSLFAHVASLSINVVVDSKNRRPAELAHGDQLARDVGLDLVAAGWVPTAASYFGRVSKAHILAAVREGKDERSARLIDHLKKDVMAAEAERLLADSGWLPDILRTPDVTTDFGETEAGDPASEDQAQAA